MTRRTRRMWRRTIAYTALAIALAAEATQIAVLAVHDRSGGELAAAVALAYLSVIALGGAVSWSWTTGRAAARNTWRGRRMPTGRRVMTAGQAAEHRARAAADERAHAAAMAAVAADAPLPERAATDAVEAVRPLPPTKPMPIVDPAAVLTPAPYAVRWAFDPDGPRTVVAEQWAGRAA